MASFRRAERGQALIIMVVALVGLLAAVGLAIDGGMVFLERRRMQNAADAAALAGARLLASAICGHTGATDELVAAEITSYAMANGVEDADGVAADYVEYSDDAAGDLVAFHPPERVGEATGGEIPMGATGVSVTVEISRTTYFVSLVGIETAGASAQAMAVASPSGAVSGVRPFGIALPLVASLGPGDCFTVNFGNCDPDDPDGPCNIEWTGGQVQHRGWMDLTYVWNQGEEDADFPRATGGSTDLKEWMENGWEGWLYADLPWSESRWGDYVHAKPGTEEDAINVAPTGEVVVVPIYDAFPDCDGDDPDIAEPYPPDACTGMAGADYYHIVGFSVVSITHTSTHSIDMCLTEKVIRGAQPMLWEGVGYGEGDACQTGAMVVTLWQ